MTAEQDSKSNRPELPPELEAAFKAAGESALGIAGKRLKESRDKKGIKPSVEVPAPVAKQEPGSEAPEGKILSTRRRGGKTEKPEKGRKEPASAPAASAVADKEKEPEAEERKRYQKAVERIEEKSEEILKEIEAFSSLKDLEEYEEGEFDIVSKAISEGKTDVIPGFDEGIAGLIDEYKLSSETLKKQFREKALASQKELEDAYAAKKKELGAGSKEEWTKERLFAEVFDGEDFVLVGEKSTSTRRKYKRDGNDILNSKGEIATDKALDQLNKGWTIEKKKAEEAKPFLEKENEPVLFDGNNTAAATRFNKVIRRGNEYFFISPSGSEQPYPHTEEQIRTLAEKEKWVVVTDDTEYKKIHGLLPLDKDKGEEASRVEEPISFDLSTPVVGAATSVDTAGHDETDTEEGIFKKLRVGEKAQYLSRDGMFYSVEKRADGYFIQDADGEWGGPHKKAILEYKAKDEGWTLMEAQKSEFFPHAIGEMHLYQAKDGLVYYVERRDDGYYLNDKDNSGRANGPHTEASIQHTAEVEEWKIWTGELKADVEVGEFVILQEGECQKYYIPDLDRECIVERIPEGYVYYFPGEGDKGQIYSEDELRVVITYSKWAPRGEVFRIGEEPVTPRVVRGGASKSPEEMAALQERINALKVEVAEARKKYAEVDYEKTSAWKTLSGFFRGLNITRKDADTDYWNSEYREKLTTLKELELESIKASGVKGASLKEQMSGLLRYYVLDEARALYDVRTQVRLERQGFLTKALGKYEEGIKWYGRQPLKVKLGISAALLIAAVPTGGVSLIARRILTGSAGTLAVDSLLNQGFKAFEDRHQRKTTEEYLEHNEVLKDEDEQYSDLSFELDMQIKALNQDLQARKLLALARKTVSLGVGFGGGLLASHILSEKFGVADHGGKPAGGTLAPTPEPAPMGEDTSPESDPRLRGESGNVDKGLPGSKEWAEKQGTGSLGTDTPAPAAAQPEGGDKNLTPPAEEPKPSEKPEVKVTEKVEPVADKALEEYKVTAADSKKGLWGIIEKRFVPDDASQAESSRIVRSLENLIQQKLDEMDPAEQKAAGFPSGKIDLIERGSTISFNTLLTPEEIQEVIDGKDIEAPQSLQAEAPSVDQQASRVPVAEKVIDTPKVDTATIDDDQPATKGLVAEKESKSVAEYDATRKLSDPKDFLKEHPEMKERLFKTVGKLRVEIFNTTDVRDFSQYNYIENNTLGKVSVSQAYKDARLLKESPFMNYNREINPLHPSQMAQVNKFMEAATKAFGAEVATPGAGESVDTYTGRMATMAVRTGKEIKGFFKP